MFFESSDGAFSGIAAMAVGRHQLVLHVIDGEKNLQSRRCLVVKSLEFRFESLGSEMWSYALTYSEADRDFIEMTLT
jgi:hypothetical protein